MQLLGRVRAQRIELFGEPVTFGLDLLQPAGVRRLRAQRREFRAQPLELLGRRRGRALGLQVGDPPPQLVDLGPQLALGERGAAPPATARRRQLDDEAAADLQLRARDLAALAVPIEGRAPRLAGFRDLGADQALTAPAGLDGQRRTPDPAAAHPVPVAHDLEPVVGRPLEALELEEDLPDLRHQLFSPASGSSGCSSDVLDRATGAPDSVGGGR